MGNLLTCSYRLGSNVICVKTTCNLWHFMWWFDASYNVIWGRLNSNSSHVAMPFGGKHEKGGTHLSAFPDAKIMNFRGECKSELKEVYSCGDFCWVFMPCMSVKWFSALRLWKEYLFPINHWLFMLQFHFIRIKTITFVRDILIALNNENHRKTPADFNVVVVRYTAACTTWCM